MKQNRKAFLTSAVSLLLCAAMLFGATTLAWFNDTASADGNDISTGKLDVQLFWTDDLDSGEWTDAEGATASAIFAHDKWEPGYTEVRYVKIVNAGTLSFRYALNIIPDGEVGILADVIDVYYIDEPAANIPSRGALQSETPAGVLSAVVDDKISTNGALLESEEIVVAVALKMQESAGNEYQGKSIGDSFSVQVLATQFASEEDSFGKDYDEGATFPELDLPASITVPVTPDADGKLSAPVQMKSDSVAVSATVPAGVQLKKGTTKLTLTVTEMENGKANITLGESEISRSLDVHIEGIADGNTVPVTVTIPEAMMSGLNMGNYTLYHVEKGVTVPMTYAATEAELNAHNEFTYDPATGDVTLAMATFSEVALTADTENAWNGETKAFAGGTGTETDPYIIANADQLAYMGDRVSNDNTNYGSAHYKLIADVNIGGIENYNANGRKVLFYPIGYNKVGGTTTDKGNWYTYGGAFKGVFDGTGHTISGIYQNTWAMVGDYSGTYYNDAMGLFGYVTGGTVKNLTIDNFYSEGEFAPTGCVAAYAAGNVTFENIAITNSHPQTYNTGVAGIVGWDEGDDSNFTFKNITVDDTNTVSALWGSWDVAAAGILGYLGANSKASFENCNVAATIDVYNDVCGNYQYYWYRYCGAFIGTVDKRQDNGKGALDLSNVTATNCTVNFGDRHEYYYCEFEKNSQASYTEDFQFSRVNHSQLNMDANPVTCKHTHTANEDKQAVYIPFRQLFGGYGWGVDGVDLGEYDNIEISDVTNAQEKFETKFTGDFLYRVGNGNAVSIGSLFAAKDDITINDSGVYVTIDKVDENSNVSGTFTANTSDWTKGTIQFSGTGVVKVTIQDYNYCKPTVLYLEVVDAVNATSATSATKNNVVLLNDCGFSSLEVSGGYTLYGNGFTMTCGSDSVALDMGYAFVTLNSGTLDNVQIVCPNFDYAALYKSNLTSSDNRSETDASGKTRYYNAKSGVMASGNSQILNSRISGGRAALNVSGGNVVVDNSRIELGAVASVLVGSANSLTLRDVTLVQMPTVSTHDSSKTLMGFSVLYLCDSEGNATPTTIEGSFVQQAWIDEDDSKYVPSAGESIITAVLKETDYLHDIDGDGTKESLNLGFAYMPEDATKTVAKPTNITDNRTDKDTIPYEMKDVSVKLSILSTTVYVYSYKNTSGTDDSFMNVPNYVPNKQSDIITVNYSDATDGLTTGKSYGTDGWVYELNVDLDEASGYALDFSKLSMSVNGALVNDFKVNGNAKPASPVAVTAGGTTYTLTATVNGKEYTATYKVTGTETSKESPSLVASNYEAGKCVASSYGGTWHGAVPALKGIQIRYWSVAENQYKTINLSDYTPTTKGKLNSTNTTWTYSPDNGDFTLTLTGGQVHSSNNVYAMPVAVDTDSDGTADTLYFVAASSNGLVNSGNSARTIPVSYTFKDNNNGDVLKFSHTWSVAENKDEQYKYSDFCNGTLTQLTSGCVTPDTLITLADGTQKEIQHMTAEDQLLVWDFANGKYTTVPSALIVNHGYDNWTVIELTFDDGTTVKAVTAHAFFDADLNEFVLINDGNVQNYVGHSFVKAVGDSYSTVKLVDYKVYEEYTESYTLVSAGHYNFITENMFSLTNSLYPLMGGLVMGDGMKYDAETLQADIEKYGMYTYADFEDYVTYEQFVAFNGPYLKISVEKGYCTFNDILALISEYLNH